MPDTNRYTVIGSFDDYNSARNAARELREEGIPEDAVQVQSNTERSAGHSGDDYNGGSHHEEGGISGFFHRLFGSDVPHEERRQYEDAVERGSTLVCVTGSKTLVDQAAEILNRLGAADIERRGSQERRRTEAYREESGSRESGGAIPVVEEEIEVGKRTVLRGGVRVYSHVVEEPVHEEVTLREERVRVERRPADRPLNANEKSALRDQTIEVTETAEEPVVRKRARVVEEVVVDKQTTERTQKIDDTVRRTQVDVEQMDPSTGARGGTAGDRDLYSGNGNDLNDLKSSAGVGNDAFRRDYEANQAGSGLSYEELEPAYQYGYRSASNPEYRGKSWDDVEQSLRTDYLRNNPTSRWDNVKGSIRYGWEKMTGKR